MDVGHDLVAAIAAGDDEHALALLEERPEVAAARDEQGVSVLMQALYHGREEVARAVRAARPKLDVFEAAALADLARLRALLGHDPSLVGAWSADGFTPLHFAAFFGGPDAVLLLVERGADLEAPARNEEFARGARPLHSAAAARRKDVCAVLLAAGADPNGREHGGYTPLLEAAQHGDVELVELLLAHGADPAARLDDGRDTADLADEAGASALAERLRAAAIARAGGARGRGARRSPRS